MTSTARALIGIETGVVDQNLDPKPAYNKLRSAIGGSPGPTTVAC